MPDLSINTFTPRDQRFARNGAGKQQRLLAGRQQQLIDQHVV